jgi:hypothetical protein
MPWVTLKNVSSDDDGTLQVVVGASNGRASAGMDVYADPADILAFACDLEGFPANRGSEVCWESGSTDPKWYGHMRLRAHVLNGSGHSVLDVLMDVRGSPPNAEMSRFSLRCNPADLNELGRRIREWIADPSVPLKVEWRDA